MTGKELQKELTWKFPHIAKAAPKQMEEAAAFCEGFVPADSIGREIRCIM